MKFELGQIVGTPGALEALNIARQTPGEFLQRQPIPNRLLSDAHDRRENELGVTNNLRVLSSYILCTGEKIWIITEADRSATTILLPSKY